MSIKISFRITCVVIVHKCYADQSNAECYRLDMEQSNPIPMPFLINGYPYCNISIAVGWTTIYPLKLIILTKNNNDSRCRIARAKRHTDPISAFSSCDSISQAIKIPLLYLDLISDNRALGRIRSQLGFSKRPLFKEFDYFL